MAAAGCSNSCIIVLPTKENVSDIPRAAISGKSLGCAPTKFRIVSLDIRCSKFRTFILERESIYLYKTFSTLNISAFIDCVCV
jgi:hypothetical protein